MATTAVKRPELTGAPYHYEYNLTAAGDTLTFSAGAGGAHGASMVSWGVKGANSSNPVAAAVVLSGIEYVAAAAFEYTGDGWTNGRRTTEGYQDEDAPFGCIRVEHVSGTGTLVWHAVSDVPLSISD